jgi:hypothetical protein
MSNKDESSSKTLKIQSVEVPSASGFSLQVATYYESIAFLTPQKKKKKKVVTNMLFHTPIAPGAMFFR